MNDYNILVVWSILSIGDEHPPSQLHQAAGPPAHSRVLNSFRTLTITVLFSYCLFYCSLISIPESTAYVYHYNKTSGPRETPTSPPHQSPNLRATVKILDHKITPFLTLVLSLEIHSAREDI